MSNDKICTHFQRKIIPDMRLLDFRLVESAVGSAVVGVVMSLVSLNLSRMSTNSRLPSAFLKLFLLPLLTIKNI
jgi:hypothetical protein